MCEQRESSRSRQPSLLPVQEGRRRITPPRATMLPISRSCSTVAMNEKSWTECGGSYRYALLRVFGAGKIDAKPFVDS